MAKLEINAIGTRPGSRVEILVDGVPLSYGEALLTTPKAHLLLEVQPGEEVTFRNASYTSVQVAADSNQQPGLKRRRVADRPIYIQKNDDQ